MRESVVVSEVEERKAMHGRTARLLRERFVGISQRWETVKGFGSLEEEEGRPISSSASRRAVSKGVSERWSALPINITNQR